MITNTKRTQANLASARKGLAVFLAAEPDAPSAAIEERLRNIARAEGACEIAGVVDAIIADSVDQTQAVREARIGHAVMEILARGSDDDWSGRGNDLRRAAFDGVCTEAKRHRCYSF